MDVIDGRVLTWASSRVPPVWDADVQHAWLSVGVIAAGLPHRGHDAVPLHLLPVWQEDQSQESIRYVLEGRQRASMSLAAIGPVAQQGSGWIQKDCTS